MLCTHMLLTKQRRKEIDVCSQKMVELASRKCHDQRSRDCRKLHIWISKRKKTVLFSQQRTSLYRSPFQAKNFKGLLQYLYVILRIFCWHHIEDDVSASQMGRTMLGLSSTLKGRSQLHFQLTADSTTEILINWLLRPDTPDRPQIPGRIATLRTCTKHQNLFEIL